MLLGVCGGIIMFALIAGALSGSVALYVGLGAAGLLLAAGSAARKTAAARRADRSSYAAYPPYGY